MKVNIYRFLNERKHHLIFLITLLISIVSYAQQKDIAELTLPDTFYPILPWDNISPRDSLKNVANCNFNVVFLSDPNDIHRAEKLNLKVIIYQNINLKTDTNKMQSLRILSDVEIENEVKKLVDISGHNESVIGYFLKDEPSAFDFHSLATAVAAIKKYAPGKLAYINLFPNYASHLTSNQVSSQLGTDTYTEYIERFINEVKPQFISYDNYMVQLSMDLRDKKSALSYYDNLLEVRRIGLKYNLPYWNTISSTQIRKNKTVPSMANMLFQAYTSLAAGYHGISWYKYMQKGYDYSPIDNEQNKTLTWYYLKEVNRQISILGPIINQFISTGIFFTSPAPDESLPTLPGKIIESIKSDEPIMVGEFVSKSGSKYAMIVNLSLERSTKFSFILINKQYKTSVIFPVTKDGSQIPVMKQRIMNDYENGFWLTAGEGILVKIGN